MVTKAPDGGRKPRVDDEEILSVFHATDDPVLSTAEVADELPIKRRGTLTRLQSLEDAGDLASKPIGGRNTVWWAVDEVDETARDAPESEPRDQDAQHSEPTTEPPTQAADGEHEDIEAVVDDVASGWDDTEARLQARKDAARAVLRYAREHGSISQQEAKDEVEPEHPVSGQSTRTWYRKNIRPVLNETAEYKKSTRRYELVIDE